jgi:Rrf2 family iron-sulfur cluster assembly transcriptional regulator
LYFQTDKLCVVHSLVQYLTVVLGIPISGEKEHFARGFVLLHQGAPCKARKTRDVRREIEAMRLSTKGRYAVMAMADLAGNETGGRPVSLADIAARQEISLSYLEQLFAKLRRGGLVTSVRGPGGGYRLSRAAKDVRIADIIIAVDEPMTATRCKTGSPKGCTGTSSRCVTHDLWEELGRQIQVFLSSVSLADVVEKRVLGRTRPCNSHAADERAAA